MLPQVGKGLWKRPKIDMIVQHDIGLKQGERDDHSGGTSEYAISYIHGLQPADLRVLIIRNVTYDHWFCENQTFDACSYLVKLTRNLEIDPITGFREGNLEIELTDLLRQSPTRVLQFEQAFDCRFYRGLLILDQQRSWSGEMFHGLSDLQGNAWFWYSSRLYEAIVPGYDKRLFMGFELSDGANGCIGKFHWSFEGEVRKSITVMLPEAMQDVYTGNVPELSLSVAAQDQFDAHDLRYLLWSFEHNPENFWKKLRVELRFDVDEELFRNRITIPLDSKEDTLYIA